MRMRLSDHFREQVLISGTHRLGGAAPKKRKTTAHKNYRTDSFILDVGFFENLLENAFVHLKIGIITLSSPHLCEV